MRTVLPLLFCCLFSCALFAQQTAPVNNLLLGYQEFPTVITSHTADNQGNQYYTGFFRGQLKINNQVLATGEGLQDIFWIKTNTNGQVIKSKTYGSANIENPYLNSLAMGNNNMLFGFSSFEPVQLGSQTFVPYSQGATPFASALVCTDTAGTVQWVRNTNLQNFRIFFANNIFHVLGSIPNNFPAIRYGNATVLDSTGRAGIAHLMLDANGNFLSAKSITARRPGQNVTLMNTGSFSDKSLLFQILVDGDSAFYINQNPVELPPTYWNYQTLMKADTSYQHVRYRVLNPQRHAIAGLGNAMLPSTAAADSIYVAFNYESNSPTLYIDGVAQQPLQNNLYVFDSTLVLRRQVPLGTSKAGYYPTNIYKRRIYFRHLLVQNGQIFFNGVYTGINESPMNAIPVKDTSLNAFPGIVVTVDQNGPSRSFMARYNLNGGNTAFQWYGNHSEYENINVTPAYLHPAGGNRIAFHQMVDNVWNPWIIDEHLNALTGSMRKNADLPESPQMIKYFSDGSRLVIGYARGKTALDSNGSFTSNGGRRDIFLVRLRAINQVVWFKRIHSTLTNADARHLDVRNGKAFFLINYVGTQNDSNYIRIENKIYNTRVNASLLASVDTAGNINVLNLTNPLLRTVFLMNVGYFSNGDLAVTTDVNPVPYRSFPSNFSPQIFRLNPVTGDILEGRKLITSGSFGLFTIHINKNDQLYISGSSYTPSSYTMNLHDGSSIVSSLQVPANPQTQFTLLKMEWNKFLWLKRASGNAMMRQNGDMVLLNNNPVFSLLSNPVPQSLSWDGQTVHNGVTAPSISLIGLNSDGTMTQKKILSNAVINYMRAGSNNQLYLSGILRSATQIDTIQIGNAGMIDAIGLVLDSSLTAKKSFRVASPYSESMTDMDIFQDTVAALAYTAQGNPQVYLNRTAVATSDYEEDAYLGTVNTRSNVVTSINNPLPPFTFIGVAPNPVINQQVSLSIQVTEPLRSVCTIYGSTGQSIASTVLQLSPGTSRYSIPLPKTTGKGVYHLVISNKRWTTTRTFIVF